MTPLLLRHTDGEYASCHGAVAAFVDGGWRDALAASLCADFEAKLGRDSVLDAVDSALESALAGGFRPLARGGERPYTRKALYRFAEVAARRDLLDERRHNARAAAPQYGIDPRLIDRLADERAATPEERVIGSEHAHQVREAAAALDELTLRVLWLRHVEQLKKPEIERAVGLTPKQVKRRLAMGNQRLYEAFRHVESGASCPARRASVLRLAFDLAGVAEARRTRAHVGHCRACALRFERARSYRRAVAGFTPLPLPLAAHAHAMGLFERASAGAHGLLARARTAHARVVGSERAAHAVGTGRGGLAAVGAGATKLLGICLAGTALVAGGAYCIGALAPRQHDRGPARPATRTVARSRTIAAQPVSSATLLRPLRHPPLPAPRRAAPTRAKHASSAHAPAQPDEFFSPQAQAGSIPAARTTPAPAPATTPPSSTQPHEFPLP